VGSEDVTQDLRVPTLRMPVVRPHRALSRPRRAREHRWSTWVIWAALAVACGAGWWDLTLWPHGEPPASRSVPVVSASALPSPSGVPQEPSSAAAAPAKHRPVPRKTSRSVVVPPPSPAASFGGLYQAPPAVIPKPKPSRKPPKPSPSPIITHSSSPKPTHTVTPPVIPSSPSASSPLASAKPPSPSVTTAPPTSVTPSDMKSPSYSSSTGVGVPVTAMSASTDRRPS
jgi:cytoskeletal protein RodZ